MTSLEGLRRRIENTLSTIDALLSTSSSSDDELTLGTEGTESLSIDILEDEEARTANVPQNFLEQVVTAAQTRLATTEEGVRLTSVLPGATFLERMFH